MPESLKAEIRAAISNAYYDARNAGETMEHAADVAATKVMEILEGPPKDLPGAFPRDPGSMTLPEDTRFSMMTLPDGSLMRRPTPLKDVLESVPNQDARPIAGRSDGGDAGPQSLEPAEADAIAESVVMNERLQTLVLHCDRCGQNRGLTGSTTDTEYELACGHWVDIEGE
jgi:hypothetical protein